MRILHVTNDLDAGGVQTYLAQLLPALRDRGHVVALGLVSGTGRLLPRLADEGIPWRAVAAVGRRGRLKWPRPVAVWQLAAWVEAFQPDVVHTHLFLGNTVGRLAAMRAKVPVIVASEHSTYFGKRWPSRRLDRWLALRTDAVVAVSQAVADHVAATEGIPAHRIRVLPHGVRRGPAWQPPPAPVRLGIIGRLHPDKGHELFLHLLAAWRAREANAVEGLVIGDGPEAPRLRALAKRLGLLPNGVRFLGWQADPSAWFSALHAVVAPSRREGFGLAVLEAMAAGLPVVCSDIPAFRELTDGGRHGRLVPLGPPRPPVVDRWLTAVRGAVQEDGGAQRQARRAYVDSRFGFGRHVQALEALYRELLASADGGVAQSRRRRAGC